MAQSTTFGQFAKRIAIRSKQVETGASRLVRQSAARIRQAVATATPVDTGRARSNWIVTLGQPSNLTRKPFSPGRDLGIGEGANLEAVIKVGNEKINSRRTGKPIYITNNLPYISELNDGTSAQAPKMFVETAVKAGSRFLKSGQARLFKI